MTIAEILLTLKNRGVPLNRLAYRNVGGFMENTIVNREIVDFDGYALFVRFDGKTHHTIVTGGFLKAVVKVVDIGYVSHKPSLRNPLPRILLSWSRINTK